MTSAAKPSTIRREIRLEVRFLEAVLRRCPGNEMAIEALAHLYTRIGRFHDGLTLDLEITRRHPADPTNWYNLACSYALTQNKDDALQALDRAVQLGYRDTNWMMKDRDLAALREDPRFRDLIARVALASS